MGFLSRKREESLEPSAAPHRETHGDLLPRIRDLDAQVKQLTSHLDQLEKTLKQLPDSSDFRLLASEIARLQGELERMEGKQKEGMLAMYAQIHKEIRSVRGDRVIEMIDFEPFSDEKMERASDQLSELARTWRKRRTNPGPQADG